jgi:hypothetical protein
MYSGISFWGVMDSRNSTAAAPYRSLCEGFVPFIKIFSFTISSSVVPVDADRAVGTHDRAVSAADARIRIGRSRGMISLPVDFYRMKRQYLFRADETQSSQPLHRSSLNFTIPFAIKLLPFTPIPRQEADSARFTGQASFPACIISF